MEVVMIRRMALAFIGVLWASTAQAQDCSQCQPQAVQCQQQAYTAQQNCLRPYDDNRVACKNDATINWYNCVQECTVYCHNCEIYYNWQVGVCEFQFNQDRDYCDDAYGATMQGCWDQYDNCQSNCSNNVASLSPVSGGGASLWNASLAAPSACVDVSVGERAPTITRPIAEL
jgi:hypothetical protein